MLPTTGLPQSNVALGENMGEQLGSVVRDVEAPTAEAQTMDDAKAELAIPRTSAVMTRNDRRNTAVLASRGSV
jgi:hypothetical protein